MRSLLVVVSSVAPSERRGRLTGVSGGGAVSITSRAPACTVAVVVGSAPVCARSRSLSRSLRYIAICAINDWERTPRLCSSATTSMSECRVERGDISRSIRGGADGERRGRAVSLATGLHLCGVSF